jgi:hypothetical protein
LAIDTHIGINRRYKKAAGAPERTPAVPDEVIVRVIDSGQITFADVARRTMEYVLSRDDFLAIYDSV